MIRRVQKNIRVLIVEDSTTTSLTLKKILEADPAITVIGIAKDGEEAVTLAQRLKPDLITMDVYLPLMDGLEVTKQLMARQPTPILVISSSAFTSQSDKVFKAISYGALDVFSKDDLLSRNGVSGPDELLKKVKFLANVKVITHPLARLSQKTESGRSECLERVKIQEDPERLVAFVGSTGSPKAISKILSTLPKSFPCGIVIVIHLAQGFVNNFVNWLQASCEIQVKAGVQGESILPGVAYIAPTGSHMQVSKNHTIDLMDDPPRNGLRPCGDYLLESAARHYGKGCIGIILTGMGRDGAIGIEHVKTTGGKTIAQDEETSAIFGMPKAAIETSRIDRVLPLESISSEILRLLKRGGSC